MYVLCWQLLVDVSFLSDLRHKADLTVKWTIGTIEEKPYHVTANLSIKYEMLIKIEDQKLTKMCS